MSVSCEYCNKTFSSVSNKNYHQKTAKACLATRPETGSAPSIPVEDFTCLECKTRFSNKYNLLRHVSTCKKVAVKEKIIELENSLKVLMAENNSLKRINKRLHASLDAITSKLADNYSES